MKKVSKNLVLPIALGVFLVSAGSALAITPGGGLYVPPSPQITDAVCLSSCSDLRTVAPGGTIQVTGENLDDVDTVLYKGKDGRVKGKARAKSATVVVATVPEDARSGTVKVKSSSGASSGASPDSLTVDDTIELGRGAPLRLTDAETTPSTAYQYGFKKPTLSYVTTSGSSSNNLRVDIVSKDGEVIRSYTRESVPSGSAEAVSWNGRTTSGKLARNGEYRFVVRSTDGRRAEIATSVRKAKKKGGNPFRFSIYGYKFPVRGPHSYGDGLGAGRGHQGQDILADCGLKIVAARAGTVYYNDYDAGGAGNYVVINTKGPGDGSEVYMHLIKPSTLKVGEKVKTGQTIGIVGSTGRSTACHLHFERWSAPGWYQGGTILDPTPGLKRWDSYS